MPDPEIDESLYLSYDRRKERPKGPYNSALSASRCRQFKEDPQKFYIEKVLGEREPMGVNLAFGIAGHDALEACLNGQSPQDALRAGLASLRDRWPEVEDRTVRFNPEDPTNPRDKETFEVSLPYVEDWFKETIAPHLKILSSDWAPYTPIKAQQDGVLGTEVPLGEEAARQGRPHSTIRGYDGEKMTDIPVAVISGVPVRGDIDVVCEWPDGSKAILDHKTVSSIVSYYPSYGGTRKGYPPSYDPATSHQLDLYSVGSGIGRAGFQFLTKYEQHVHEENGVWKGWAEEDAWRKRGNRMDLPMGWVELPSGELRYVVVWRPQPQDAPFEPSNYRVPVIESRAKSYLRDVAEEMTVSFLLLEDGVPPEIAFPAGDPGVIGKKMCPFCGVEEHCPTPRFVRDEKEKRASEEAYREAVRKRGEIAEENTEVQKRREHWQHQWR
jgi:hypothetical protein